MVEIENHHQAELALTTNQCQQEPLIGAKISRQKKKKQKDHFCGLEVSPHKILTGC